MILPWFSGHPGRGSVMRLAAVAVGLVGLLAGRAAADDPVPLAPAASGPLVPPDTRVMTLVRMTQVELEALYRQADVGTAPRGPTRGRAILDPDKAGTALKSRAVRVLWRGKVFRDDGIMINRTFAGRAVEAEVFLGESWLDGRPALILDYARTSKLFAAARDEMREIAPGLYLGITYLRKCPHPEVAAFYVIDARCR